MKTQSELQALQRQVEIALHNFSKYVNSHKKELLNQLHTEYPETIGSSITINSIHGFNPNAKPGCININYQYIYSKGRWSKQTR